MEEPVEINIDPDATELELNHSRLRRIEHLEQATALEFLGLRYNMIKKIENIAHLLNLRELGKRRIALTA